ncbi:hypothetical protein G9A89_004134 [Geosiphon pyriformis]|nr:hypothetical protein G9A89_004134 [Geosiphon pyriformis]
MSLVLGNPLYFNVVCFLKIAGVAYGDQLLDKKGSVRRLGSRGPMPLWFLKVSTYLNSCLHASSSVSLSSVCASVLDSMSFADICEKIHGLWANEIDVVCGTATYFSSLNKGLGVKVHNVLSSTLAELQAVVLALKCVPTSVSVALHTDSQAAIDACVAKLGFLQPDCCNSCWIERCHMVDLIKSKDLTVHWIKVKGHAGIAGNVMADAFAEQAVHSRVSFPVRINCRYVVANGRSVSGNARYFVCDIFCSICKFQWEFGTLTLTCSLGRLYNKDYPNVLCLFCGDMELPNHGFTCVKNAFVWSDILGDFDGLWKTLMDPNLLLPSFVLQDLSLKVSDVGLYLVFCKGFVLKSWMDEAIASFSDKKKAVFVVVDFICHLTKSYRINLWLFRTKFRSDMERSGLIGNVVVVAGAFGVGALPLSAGMVRLTGVLDSLNISFGFRNRFLFLSGAVHRISVSISV